MFVVFCRVDLPQNPAVLGYLPWYPNREPMLTFDLDGGRGLGTAGGRRGLARVRGRVVGADDVEREST